MDEQTRYRVTGSLFLLAVAIIIFPMLFDGEGLKAVQIEPLDVPKTVPDVDRRDDIAPATDFEARVEELAGRVDEEGFQTDAAGTRFGEPVLTEANAATRVWAVQVASFGEEGNALKLRDRLRSDGYEAFISTVKQEGQVLSRVAVGPFLEESEAEALRGELSAALSLNARIVAFSN